MFIFNAFLICLLSLRTFAVAGGNFLEYKQNRLKEPERMYILKIVSPKSILKVLINSIFFQITNVIFVVPTLVVR